MRSAKRTSGCMCKQHACAETADLVSVTVASRVSAVKNHSGGSKQVIRLRCSQQSRVEYQPQPYNGLVDESPTGYATLAEGERYLNKTDYSESSRVENSAARGEIYIYNACTGTVVKIPRRFEIHYFKKCDIHTLLNTSSPYQDDGV